jgi:hypothetical protein
MTTYTLFDFITQVKGAEYLIAVSAVLLFIVLWQVLSPRPFKAMMETAREDLKYINQGGGYSSVARTAGHVVAAPFLAIAYIAALPFVFLFSVSLVIVEGVEQAIDVSGVWVARMVAANKAALARLLSASTSFSWRPQEAYFLGRKRRKARDKDKDADKNKKEED